MNLATVAGEPSYRVQTDKITFCVTKAGGQLGPVVFGLPGGLINPLSVAPWCGHEDARGLPPILRCLRGDFFCMPFGSNEAKFGDESHPIHGETANEEWQFESIESEGSTATLRLSLTTKIRPGKVTKEISVREGHLAVYQSHRISGVDGPMCVGHHAMLQFPATDSFGLVSTSPFSRGQVFPGKFEKPETGGYSCLEPGAMFAHLGRVPTKDGTLADLTRYPAREGYEDLVMISSGAQTDLAWSAVVFPNRGYLWIGLKDRRTLPSTVLWHSNGGRHYAPWKGRHRGVLGIEEVCANFHYGLAESVAENSVAAMGIPTFHELRAESALDVRYGMAVHPVLPADAKHLREAEPCDRGLRLIFEDGRQDVLPLDFSFILGGGIAQSVQTS